jgi:nicotinamidase/pyrazinamidase
VTVTGLAADVCVRYTTLDALDLGYKVFLIKNATRAVGGDEELEKTVKELREKGAGIVNYDEVMEMMKGT